MSVLISLQGKFQDRAVTKSFIFLDTDFTDENETFDDGFGH